jgi:hypothetical protein
MLSVNENKVLDELSIKSLSYILLQDHLKWNFTQHFQHTAHFRK